MLLVIESEHGKRFGGYRGFKLDQGEGKWYNDDKAFVFSLSNKSKHEIVNKPNTYYNHASNGGAFA
jgi:hypothetical protein